MKSLLIASLLLIVGLLLSVVMVKQIAESLAPYGWQQIECLIERSDVTFQAEAAERCKHSLQYQYEIDGARETGTTWRLDPGIPYSRCSDWASFASRFPTSTLVSCFVDPADSNRVVLDRGNVFSILKLILPLGLIILGVSILRRKSTMFPPNRSGVKRLAQGIALCISIGGIIGTYIAGFLPLYESYDSKSWNNTECEVLSSSLRTSAESSGGGSQTRGYYLDIIYSYLVNEHAFVSDRYDYRVFGSGSAESLSKITDRYVVGEKVPCSVNPGNPYEAVLEPGFSPDYLWGLLPLIAVFAGCFLMIGVRRL